MAEGTPDELKTMVPAGLVELEFGGQEQLAAAQRALDGQHIVSREDAKLLVTTGSVAEMADLLIRLRDSGIEPTRFTKQTPTLDDVFFKILEEEMEDSHESSK